DVYKRQARFHSKLAEITLPRTVWDAVRAREHPGGTGPEHVARAIAASRADSAGARQWLESERQRIEHAFARLLSEDVP
ncbi:MAG: argininosuccinate lyase, partial [Thermomicrobium sp.]|nr:argininosuccinate lyase [Thermomicrobium sp.]